MKLAGILAVFAALMVANGNATAVPSGETVEFAESPGKVTLDSKPQSDKDWKCAACNIEPKLFDFNKGREWA